MEVAVSSLSHECNALSNVPNPLLISRLKGIEIPVDKYLPYMESTYPRAFRLLAKAGIHPRENLPQTNPWTGERVTESFANIGKHSVAVAMGVHVLATALVKHAVIEATEVSTIVECALLHDATKLVEIFARAAVRSHHLQQATVADQRAQLVNEWCNFRDSPKGPPKFSHDERKILMRANLATGITNLVNDYACITKQGVLQCRGRVEWLKQLIRVVDNCVFSPRNSEAHSLFPCPLRCDACDPERRYTEFWNGDIVTQPDGSCIIQMPEASRSDCKQSSSSKVLAKVFQFEVFVTENIAEKIRAVLAPQDSMNLGTDWLCRYLGKMETCSPSMG